MKRYLLDTNVILRFLRRDDHKQSPQAAELFEQAAQGDCVLRIGWHVVAECVWALRHHYDAPRETIVLSLTTLIASESIECDHKPAILDGLARYESSKLDIVDCLLAAESAAENDVIATFDRGIHKRFGDVETWDKISET